MNVIIVHGANEDKESAFEGGRETTRHFFPWLREELGTRGISFSNELYPRDWEPDYMEWKEIFEENPITEKTVLVGHSLGCGFILRWMAESKKRVKKVILVAPYVLDGPDLPGLQDMVSFEFDDSLSECWEDLVVFSSENDFRDILASVDKINEVLSPRHILFADRGHFTKKDMGAGEFPELLEEILSAQ